MSIRYYGVEAVQAKLIELADARIEASIHASTQVKQGVARGEAIGLRQAAHILDSLVIGAADGFGHVLLFAGGATVWHNELTDEVRDALREQNNARSIATNALSDDETQGPLFTHEGDEAVTS